MSRQYKDPIGGNESSVGTQLRDYHIKKKALIEARKKMYFGQMADTTSMPKHFGKTIKQHHYIPMLDDANINDQGIDANGVTLAWSYTIVAFPPRGDGTPTGNPDLYSPVYFVGEDDDATEATAKTNAQTNAEAKRDAWITMMGFADKPAAITAGWGFADSATGVAPIAVPATGNLYGSSKDVGYISGKMPALSETGGRVNRVGFKRVELEGSIEKLGFFDEYTQESLDFDSDAELEMHVNREMLNGAMEITEDALQIDLLNGAGVVRLGGDALSTDELSGDEGGVAVATPDVITYEDLMRLSIDLDDNRCPKNTTLISGSRMIDTRTIDSARYMYIGSELIPMVKKMTDSFGNQAFIAVQHYASAGNVAEGEIGSVDQFRFIVVPEMMRWTGKGAIADSGDQVNAGYRETDGNYDVFPMLVVGSGSFTTIGFQTDGKTVKFKIKHSKPESDMSYGHHDPYGELGFMSIKWYYGTMILRPERLALCKTVAEW
jgi:N4-gp56 family major capsid protein